MDYYETNVPTTPFNGAMFLDGPPDDADLVHSGYVGSRIRELNIKTSNTNLKAQSLPYVKDAREEVTVCSPACQRTRLEVSASPPVGHSYPGLRVYEDHIDDNGVAWEVAATSSHRFNVKPRLRGSKSSNSVALHSPTRYPDRFRDSQNFNDSAGNRADGARSNFKSPMRSRANLRASLPPFRTVHEVLDSSKQEQQDALDMFDQYGVSRPEGWLTSEKERQQAAGVKTVRVCHSCGGYLHTRARCARCGHEFCVKCRTELVSGLSTNAPGENISKQEAWSRGVTHSRSAANLSEPVLDRDQAFHRLSHLKSSDAVSTYLRGSRCSHGEAEQQAHQQLRHERRQRLEKSHSEGVHPEQRYGCPICHVSNDRPRHSICCIARQSQSGRQLVGQDKTGEDATYNSSSKDSFQSAHRRLEADGGTNGAASVTCGYTAAEQAQKQERHRVMELDEANSNTDAPPSHSNTRGIWHDEDRQSSTRQRLPDPANGPTAHAQQAMEQDTFWVDAEQPGTPQRYNVPQSAASGHQNTPRLTLEGKDLESEVSRSSTSAPGDVVWKTPATSRHMSPSGTDDGMLQPPRNFISDEQTERIMRQQPQVQSPRERGSPAKRADHSTPETAKRSGGKTLESRDSVKATSGWKSPQQTIESSDPSKWKQQLRKLNDTPASRAGSPRFNYSVASPDSERRLRQPPAAAIADGSLRGSPSRPKIDGGKKMTSDLSGGDAEMPISHHICEWRTRYLGLSSAFDKLKIELDTALDQQEGQHIAEEESQRHRYGDDEIEGLTIIVHRRSREDLVLNTDLRDA
ncbi:hypothetical protein M440DRAFT_1335095 [Trichoderma longibrachiatum ATCC 18648]|uniref:Uncharacterized protein n=1 Tax=Trichoderma longibrachiatum ATCC 18648 TaxID=983965 RepID=A0A2T4C2I9_TRILO|nr:hypothetical protein M440DRAFT_1335095 [Trichoderma longibrachiatum ATCC 18648]